MRYRSSSSLSYRNVLIAAGLAVGLGVVGSATAKPAAATAPRPQSDGQSNGSPAPAASQHRTAAFIWQRDP